MWGDRPVGRAGRLRPRMRYGGQPELSRRWGGGAMRTLPAMIVLVLLGVVLLGVGMPLVAFAQSPILT
jgi:hypothetical protein